MEIFAHPEEIGMASFMAGNPALKATHQQMKTKMDSTVEDFRGHLLSAPLLQRFMGMG